MLYTTSSGQHGIAKLFSWVHTLWMTLLFLTLRFKTQQQVHGEFCLIQSGQNFYLQSWMTFRAGNIPSFPYRPKNANYSNQACLTTLWPLAAWRSTHAAQVPCVSNVNIVNCILRKNTNFQQPEYRKRIAQGLPGIWTYRDVNAKRYIAAKLHKNTSQTTTCFCDILFISPQATTRASQRCDKIFIY
jgi:hypothetical protein